MLNASRAQSHSMASCSGSGAVSRPKARPWGSGRGWQAPPGPHGIAPQRRQSAAARRAARPPPPRATPDPEAAAAEKLLEQMSRLRMDTINESVSPKVMRLNNVRPDFSDPRWADQVDDWDEFWFTSAWDDQELAELNALEDEHDAPDTPEDEEGEEGGSAVALRGPAARLARARQLISALRNIGQQESAVHILGAMGTLPRMLSNAYEHPPDEVTMRDPNPRHDAVYLRAMAEKRQRRLALDQEWRRRQAMIGVNPPMDYSNDVRLRDDHFVRENWSHEQIMELIEGGGKYASVEDVEPYAVVLNPLAPVDYHNDCGVEAVIDTEDYIRQIGHLLEPQDMFRLDAEVDASEADFVDPSVAFEDEAGNVYMQAPPNSWQHLSRMRTAEDIAFLMGDKALADPEDDTGGVTNATTASDRMRGKVAAGAGDWTAPEDEGSDDDDDEWLPEP